MQHISHAVYFILSSNVQNSTAQPLESNAAAALSSWKPNQTIQNATFSTAIWNWKISYLQFKKYIFLIMSHNQVTDSSSSAGWWILKPSGLLIAGSLPSFLRLISLSACASSFHESSEIVPPGRRGYQLMVCLQEEIRLTKLHPVLDVQWCSKSNSLGPRMACFNTFQSLAPMYESRQGGLLGGRLLGGAY